MKGVCDKIINFYKEYNLKIFVKRVQMMYLIYIVNVLVGVGGCYVGVVVREELVVFVDLFFKFIFLVFVFCFFLLFV